MADETAGSAPEQGLKDGQHQRTSELVGRLCREHLKPQMGRIVTVILCMIVVAGASAALVYMLAPVIDEVLVERDRQMLYVLPGLIIGLSLVRGAAGYGETYLMEVVGHRMVARLQNGMYGRIIHADLSFFHDNAVGSLVARFVNDANMLRQSVAKSLTCMMKDSLTVAFLVVVLFVNNWILALFTVVVFPLSFLPIARIGRRIRRFSRSTQSETATLTTMLDETFRGIRNVKAYGVETRETERANDVIERIYELMRKTARAQAFTRPLMETLGGIALAVAVLSGGFLVIGGTMSPGELASFMAALLAAYKPMKSIANLNAVLQQGLAAAQRVFAILDLQPRIVSRRGATRLHRIRGDIRFEGVSFGYVREADALDGVDIDIPAGKTVALVGPSGAGKSTALSLIPRFFDADRGSVAIDGHDVRGLTLDSLRAGISLVSQDTTLFDTTIRANIVYGRPDAGEAEIVQAARNAGAHDFIAELQDGYDTHVGGRGVKLSGGQCQRIAIARAMLRDSPILLLDEATSALDTATERAVQAAINRLKQGRTTVVIAHRLSTVADADMIFVMDSGRVIEAGSHAELLARNGAFARLHALQQSGEEVVTPLVRAKA